MPEPVRHFQRLKRVRYEWRTDPALSWAEVAELMRESPQALAVVNIKKDALALLDALEDPQALHLSTLLCGTHRRQVIEEVKRRLAAQEPCRLVATQVVEAGVDLDFPLVLRALGPLDSIIQAAGRCNREGKMQGLGRVIVFAPAEGGMPQSAFYKVGTSATVTLRRSAELEGVETDLDDPVSADRYFRHLYETLKGDLDRKDIQDLRARLSYTEVARKFQMIDGETEGLVVTQYGSEEERQGVRNVLDRLRQGGPDARSLLRQLQPYIVSVYRGELARFHRESLVAELRPGLWEWMGGYDSRRGLTAETLSTETLVV
ncbi:MAG: hypothetical protein HY689_14145 [Chloroflexi bacterium]|nr:hypothetical protein [Chloroflexota bacterium]